METLTRSEFKCAAKGQAQEMQKVFKATKAWLKLWQDRADLISKWGWDFADHMIVLNAGGEQGNTRTLRELCSREDGTPMKIVERAKLLKEVKTTAHATAKFHIYAHNFDEDGMAAAHKDLMNIDVDAINMLADAAADIPDMRVEFWNTLTEEFTAVVGENAYLQFSNCARDRHEEREKIMAYARNANAAARR
jgi:hypothetical protein